jgi:hypothetical protein
LQRWLVLQSKAEIWSHVIRVSNYCSDPAMSGWCDQSVTF